MTGLLTIFGILAVTCLFCKAFDKEPEEYFSASIFTVVVLLYPFYCLDILRIGRYMVYAMAMGITLFSISKIAAKTKLFCSKNIVFIPPLPGNLYFCGAFGFLLPAPAWQSGRTMG